MQTNKPVSNVTFLDQAKGTSVTKETRIEQLIPLIRKETNNVNNDLSGVGAALVLTVAFACDAIFLPQSNSSDMWLLAAGAASAGLVIGFAIFGSIAITKREEYIDEYQSLIGNKEAKESITSSSPNTA